MANEKKHKSWKTVATIDNFETADELRTKLLKEHEAVKVKRGRKLKTNDIVFRVKVWDKPKDKSDNKNVRSR